MDGTNKARAIWFGDPHLESKSPAVVPQRRHCANCGALTGSPSMDSARRNLWRSARIQNVDLAVLRNFTFVNGLQSKFGSTKNTFKHGKHEPPNLPK